MSKRNVHKDRATDIKKSRQAGGLALIEVVGLSAGALLFYMGAEFLLLSNPHPLHWLAAAFGGVLGYIGGHLWHLSRGDIA